jgi:hypothetical protein
LNLQKIHKRALDQNQQGASKSNYLDKGGWKYIF